MIIATLSKRVISFFVDILLIYISAFFFIYIFHIKYSILTLMVVAAIFSMCYFPFYWVVFRGRTIGNFTMGIKLSTIDSSKLNFKTSLLRASILLTLIFPYGIIVFLAVLNIIQSFLFLKKSPYKENKQTAWDVASKTIVIQA